MEKQLLSFSEDVRRLKSKLVVFSSISLFIGLTEALPSKLTLIGLDFSGNQKILGWFIFCATLLFLLTFLVSAGLEIFGSYLTDMIKWKTSRTTGEILGFSEKDISDEYEKRGANDSRRGDLSGEQENINWQNDIITSDYKRNFTRVKSWATIVTNCFAPVIFSSVGLCFLYRYLMQL